MCGNGVVWLWYGYGMVMVWYGMEMYGNGMVTLWYGTVWYVMLWYVFIYVYIGGQKKWHKVAGPNIYMYILFDIYICNVCHVSFSSYIYIINTTNPCCIPVAAGALPPP